MAAALARVKRDLGPEAVILHTRNFKTGGFLGFGGRPVVEITASAQVNVLPRKLRPSIIGPQPRGPAPMTDGAVQKNAVDSPALRKLTGEVNGLSRMVEELLRDSRLNRTEGMPQPFLAAYQLLIENQVAEDIASQLIDEIKHSVPHEQWEDPPVMRSALAAQIANMVPTAGPLEMSSDDRPNVVVLVGPTGVGKTTTIAKLAAQYSLRMNKRVGLVTLDTYRIAAVDQLRTYAEILNVPLKVVLSPSELDDAIREMSDFDLVLVDTAGRSQNDAIRLNELKRFLAELRSKEVHLVLSTTSNQANLLQAAERFCGLGVDRIIFTKLDESVGVGVMLNGIRRVNRKISYLTNGQEVPDHIRVGRPEDVADLILPFSEFVAGPVEVSQRRLG